MLHAAKPWRHYITHWRDKIKQGHNILIIYINWSLSNIYHKCRLQHLMLGRCVRLSNRSMEHMPRAGHMYNKRASISFVFSEIQYKRASDICCRLQLIILPAAAQVIYIWSAPLLGLYFVYPTQMYNSVRAIFILYILGPTRHIQS